MAPDHSELCREGEGFLNSILDFTGRRCREANTGKYDLFPEFLPAHVQQHSESAGGSSETYWATLTVSNTAASTSQMHGLVFCHVLRQEVPDIQFHKGEQRSSRSLFYVGVKAHVLNKENCQLPPGDAAGQGKAN